VTAERAENAESAEFADEKWKKDNTTGCHREVREERRGDPADICRRA
jgi:hypothetical protein